MKSRHHLFVTLFLVVPYIIIGEYFMALLSLVFGVFIDVDHSIDYYIAHGEWTVSPTKLSNMNNLDIRYLFLHSWELVILMIGLSLWKWSFFGVTMAVVLHLYMDHLGNKISFKQLWLIWRIKNGFVIEDE